MLALSALSCAGSTPPPAPADPVVPTHPFVIEEAPSSFAARPQLLGRLLSSPHGYFRYINLQFGAEVCRVFAAEIAEAPTVNLHGDAHLEQYAVTDLGRGLTDFDDSSRGPAVIDLVRFIASLHLAATITGRSAQVDTLVDSFLRGYVRGLRHPEKPAPPPALAARLSGSFTQDRSTVLTGADELMRPLDVEPAVIQQALDRYAEPLVREQRAQASSFRVKKAGRLLLGIGSARDQKYLVRVEGPTADDQDDVVLELKEVRDLRGVPCLDGKLAGDPFRILVGSARIAYRPFDLLGYTALRESTYWIHAWTDNYAQIEVESSFRSSAELVELAFDVGVQLGRGHPHLVATPLDAQLRSSLLSWQEQHDAKIRSEGARLAADVIRAWRTFAAQLTEG